MTSGGTSVRLRQAGPGQLSGGVGGWEAVARSRRSEASEWVGTPAFVYVVPVVLGNGSASVEADLRSLRSWARPRSGGRTPPRVTLGGPALPFGLNLAWVINDLTLEESGLLIRNAAGARLQQPMTVTFRQYVEASVVRGPASKSKAGR